MAVRFDASSEQYTAALSLGSPPNFTVCCWARLAVDRATTSTFWELAPDNQHMQVNGAATVQYFDAVTYVAVGPSLVVGAWYFIGLSVAGASGLLYVRAADGTVTADTWASSTRQLGTLYLGDNEYDEWLNGNLAAVKIWTAGLSQAELELECQQQAPRRLANLVSFYPFVRAELTDYSGGGNALSGGIGTTTEDGPPIPWRVASPRLILPAAAAGGSVTGSGASALGGLTATASGVRTVNGNGASTLGALAASASGTRTVNGAGVSGLGGLAASATGTREVRASGVAQLGALVATAVSGGITGSGAANLGALAASAVGARAVSGSAAAALGALASTASGTRAVRGTGLAQLGALVAQVSESENGIIGRIGAPPNADGAIVYTVNQILGGIG